MAGQALNVRENVEAPVVIPHPHPNVRDPTPRLAAGVLFIVLFLRGRLSATRSRILPSVIGGAGGVIR